MQQAFCHRQLLFVISQAHLQCIIRLYNDIRYYSIMQLYISFLEKI